MTASPLPASPLSAPGRDADLPGGATRDLFIGGKVEVLQPRGGRHRSGLDAVFLSAMLPDSTTGRLVDLGAGVGVAGLCATARLPGITTTLVERDPLSLRLARASLELAANAPQAGRVTVLEADVTARGRAREAAGLAPDSAEHVIMNPPYYAPGRHRASPNDARAGAHMLGETGLEPWLRTASSLLVAGGSLSIIFRADGLDEILTGMAGRFGDVTVFPLFAREGQAAHRILVRGIRGSRAPLRLTRGLVLHADTASGYGPAAEEILRHGAGLAINA